MGKSFSGSQSHHQPGGCTNLPTMSVPSIPSPASQPSLPPGVIWN